MSTNCDSLKILFLSSDPSDATRLRLGQELRDIQERLQSAIRRDNIKLESRASVRISDISQAILDVKPQIVHFSGHGMENGSLCFEDANGFAKEVKAEAISSLFALFSGEVQCVVMNACYSYTQAKEISRHIDYVIGMQSAISDEAALIFSAGLFKAIGAGRSIEDSYNFGITELKLHGNKDHQLPVLLKRVDQKDIYNDSIPLNHLSSICSKAYRWLISQQIESSGGWGKKQNDLEEKLSSRKLSPLEKNEGGIITTFMALRALLHYENDVDLFRSKKYSRNALKYLLARQDSNGGFGRYIESRSGKEIHPSIRHTAFAVSSLIDLNGPPNAIFDGIRYIRDNWSITRILSDAAPSLAIAGILYLTNKIKPISFNDAIVTDGERKLLDPHSWEEKEISLIRQLLELSNNSDSTPYWPPYARNTLRSYETSVVTMDLLPIRFLPILESTNSGILSDLVSNAVSGALPYGPGLHIPDIGLSANFLQLVTRPDFIGSLKSHQLLNRIAELAHSIANLLLSDFENSSYWEYAGCDSLPSILLLNTGRKHG